VTFGRPPLPDTFTLAAAAQQAGLSQHQVRVYLDMGLLRPCGATAGGFRLFDENCIRRLKLIKACRDAELNLAEIAGFVRGLDSDDPARCHAAERLLRERIQSKRLALRRCTRVLSAAAFTS
jgi:MerR family mercuric resistance operon transcriptional regulator